MKVTILAATIGMLCIALSTTTTATTLLKKQPKCSVKRKHKGETFEKVFKTGLVWMVHDTPRDWTPRDLYIQTEKVGDKVMPWLDKRMLYVMPGGATSYGLDCRTQQETYLCHFLCNPERSTNFIVVYGKKEKGNQDYYRVTLEKSVQGEGKKDRVYLKSVEKANTKGRDEQLDFTIRKPTPPIYLGDEEKPAKELTKSWAHLVDLPTWEQFIMHADEQGKFDQLSKKQNKLLSDNSKEQESAFFAHAAKQEEMFFGKNRRRRLLDSKTKSAKIQS
eukprot:g3516.t1